MNTVLVKQEGPICELTLNRPESLNALNDELMGDLMTALSAAEADANVRCVVIKGAGPNFMAGGDIKMFAKQLGQSPAQLKATFKEFIGTLHPLIVKLSDLRVPLVCAAQGAVAGFGVSLTMLCDFVLVSDDGFFSLAYVHLGTTPDGSSTWFLPRLVGLRRDKEIAMLGERIPADEAVRLRLASKAVPRASLDAEAAAFAARLAAGPTHAYANTKALLHASFNRSLSEQMEAEADSFAECASGPDFAEGVKSFIERRKPAFQGK